jgi:hypothetical protein
MHVDTLDPPEHPIPPIAPFLGDHQRSHDLTIHLSDNVEPQCGITQGSVHSGRDHCRTKLFVLCVLSHLAIETDENRSVVGICDTNLNIHDYLLPLWEYTKGIVRSLPFGLGGLQNRIACRRCSSLRMGHDSIYIVAPHNTSRGATGSKATKEKKRERAHLLPRCLVSRSMS